MSNRIEELIVAIDASVKSTDPEKIKRNCELLNMTVEDHFLFQNIKSEAQLNGDLTLEEAMSIYGYLGESVQTFNSQPFAVKYATTRILQHLLEDKIKRKQNG
jgi:hypothetical protein